ncbi:helix-turn-helix transcriptional regulator [Shimia abyssi]|uniref:Regulatory LuxR family protein n=1 Tax=Shimia abyssi TaxID=1662395 RepID=A0A2P8FGX2_9RHOB|nr:LuxR C-terminal-related transcriptional regulator [Shimia abyssi]PSL20984.1 regulatory LuxR family protein [Shimia abyssi]
MLISGPERRPLLDAERHVPELLHNFLVDLETTAHSSDVWRLLVGLGRTLNVPYVDMVSASSYENWKKTLFVRTSYDSTWLTSSNQDPDLSKWSYFRSHAMKHLTPIAVGLEFADEFHHVPEARYLVLREAAARGMRSGFSIPLRVHAPPQAALITFSGDHAKRDMHLIIQTHGWVLQSAAMSGFQRYMTHFAAEFTERNAISDKQRELLELIGAGLQDKTIAERLGVTVSAVRQRMNQILKKTGLGNRAELAALAMSMGLLPDPLAHLDDGQASVLVEMGVVEAGRGKIRRR